MRPLAPCRVVAGAPSVTGGGGLAAARHGQHAAAGAEDRIARAGAEEDPRRDGGQAEQVVGLHARLLQPGPVLGEQIVGLTLEQAAGRILGHNVAGPDGRPSLHKGRPLTAADIAMPMPMLAGWVGNHIDPGFARFDANVATLEARIPAPSLGVVPHMPRPDVAIAASALSEAPRLLRISLAEKEKIGLRP